MGSDPRCSWNKGGVFVYAGIALLKSYVVIIPPVGRRPEVKQVLRVETTGKDDEKRQQREQTTTKETRQWCDWYKYPTTSTRLWVRLGQIPAPPQQFYEDYAYYSLTTILTFLFLHRIGGRRAGSKGDGTRHETGSCGIELAAQLPPGLRDFQGWCQKKPNDGTGKFLISTKSFDFLNIFYDSNEGA